MKTVEEIDEDLSKPFGIPAILGAEQEWYAYEKILKCVKEILEKPLYKNCELAETCRNKGIKEALEFLLEDGENDPL